MVPSAPYGYRCDVLIAGCGASGLYVALNLPSDAHIIMLSKGALDECDSMLAQGGMATMVNDADFDSFVEDTMRAGHYENRVESVHAMVGESREIVADLLSKGVRFKRDEAGGLRYTREAGHSKPRICYYEDLTGAEITERLLDAVLRLPNVSIMENTTMTDIIEDGGACCGVEVCEEGGGSCAIYADYTVLATGGIGGLYERTTNFSLLTGDGCRIAKQHGVELEHMDYVQIHPTSLFTREKGRAFLVSESARGEGAVLLDAHGERFTDELQPRDVVTAAVYEQMRKDATEHVWLSFENMDASFVRDRFPNIYKRCLQEGYDITREPIPVVPAQHYFMGGIHVDANSATSMPCLYAVGETSCNGVHGKNRLASNSLLESMVFARRAARDIAQFMSENA